MTANPEAIPDPVAPRPAGSDAVRITSDVVRITIEYADGSAEGAEGPDAAAIWRHILGMYVMAQIHGRPYSGPQFRPIRRAGGTGEDRS